MFQHDYDSVHKFSSMKIWFAKDGVEELECPVQSPNLNLTDQIWDKL